jgi:dienelactone hydrolase
MEERAFGAWESPVTPELMAKGGVRLAFPDVCDDGALAWIETRPSESGRAVPVRSSGIEVPAPRTARSRVHEYGGRPHLVVGKTTWFVDGADGRLYRHEGGEPVAVGDPSGFRLADLVLHPTHPHRAVAIGERKRDGQEPENLLVSLSLETGEVKPLASGHAFYAAPAISPDGKQLGFLAWNHPFMAWDAATLYVADLADDLTLGPARAICGDSNGAAFQPTWSPSGTLYFALEAGERWSLHRLEHDRVTLVADAGVELGAPLWNLGTRLFGFVDDHTVIGTGLWDGRSRVVRIDVDTRAVTTLSTAFPHVGELATNPRATPPKALFLCGWAGGGTRLVEMDATTGATRVVRNTLEGVLEPAFVSEPEAISYPTSGGATAHGNFYAPRSARFSGPSGALPPLVVTVHGGPTGCANTELLLAIQFWTTRGFAVLDVNYRGSTGFGRSYREALRGRWGEVDVDDCVAGVRHLASEERIDADRAIIRGASAGGYTVLQALCDHDVFRAGACLYGPSDPSSFVHETHKFEKHYDAFLFGTGDAYQRALVERAPIRKVDRIRAPVIFFQGLEDPAVVPAQTERVHRALADRGVETEYHGIAGEQHGFRKAETIALVWAKELAFYRRVLAF